MNHQWPPLRNVVQYAHSYPHQQSTYHEETVFRKSPTNSTQKVYMIKYAPNISLNSSFSYSPFSLPLWKPYFSTCFTASNQIPAFTRAGCHYNLLKYFLILFSKYFLQYLLSNILKPFANDVVFALTEWLLLSFPFFFLFLPALWQCQ